MTSALKRESSRGPTKFEEAGSTIFRAAFKMYPRLEIPYSYKGTFRLLLKTFITRIDLYALDLQLFLSKLSSYSWKLLFHLNSEATLRYFFFKYFPRLPKGHNYFNRNHQTSSFHPTWMEKSNLPLSQQGK